ncbi:MAG: NAD-dependent epimerase/dehydratase family protein [Candidatus Eisenbacteria bacterium]|nr:NAD-dependent epimerase/dehydratase family protein [Candidatus Eisenbacteria bacterium]
MRVLVTGANGFIGSTLTRRLLRDGHAVRCLIHRAEHRLRGLPIELVRGSVRDRGCLARALSGVECVFHLAGRATDWGPRELFYRINVDGTRHLLDAAAAAGTRRLVFTSSLAVHRFSGHVDAGEQTAADQTRYAYGASKVAAEHLVRTACIRGLLETVIVRPGVVVYGPQDTTAFADMAPLLARGRWTHVIGGRALLCTVYVDNLVDALLAAATNDAAAGRIYNVTDDRKLTWRDYISAAITAFGARERSLSVPRPLARAAGMGLEALWRAFGARRPPPITDYRTALVADDFHFNCERAKRELAYRPRVELEEGLRRTVDWWREAVQR